MVTWMEHDKHGRHPATGAEIESLKLNGWKIMEKKNKESSLTKIVEVLEKPARGRPRSK